MERLVRDGEGRDIKKDENTLNERNKKGEENRRREGKGSENADVFPGALKTSHSWISTI